MSPKKSTAKPKKAARPKKASAAKKAKPKKKPAAAKKPRPTARKTAKAGARKKVAKKAAKARVAKKVVKKPARARVAKKAVKKTAVKPKARTAKKAPAKAVKKPAAKAAKKAPAKPKATGRVKAAATSAAVVKPAPAPPDTTKGAKGTKGKAKGRTRRRSSRRAIIRRGPDGEILAPGDLLLPGGAKGEEEIQYLFRGCMAAEHPVAEEAIAEVLTKRAVPEGPGEREELQAALDQAGARFGGGDVEPVIPVRNNLKKTFQGVVERARQRRREIGAFLRGLDMGHTETSHMDAHGEASLQSLMEWAARLENLVENLTETQDMNQAHYTQFHRVLDQLEATTEALVIDVEQTLRRLRDRLEH